MRLWPAFALHDERVERGAADENGEQQGESLFADHVHGFCSLVLLWFGRPRSARERGERSRRPGLRTIWECARNIQSHS